MSAAALPAAFAAPDVRLPLHGQLRDALAERIAAGEWPPGTAMPAEAKLAQDYSVSVHTMRRAIRNLREEGLVDCRHGRGTFTRSAEAAASLSRFFRLTDARGQRTDQPPHSEILTAGRAALSEAPAQRLGRPSGESALQLLRRRSWDGEVILLETIHLPLPEADGLLFLAPKDYGALLYPVMQQHCGILVARVEDEISVGQAEADAAVAFGIAPGDTVIVVERTAFDLRGQPVEARRAIGRADRFRYRAVAT